MARKVDTEEERLRRILLIRDYALKQIENNQPFSTRSIARYFTDNAGNNGFFKISNNTVSAYIEFLVKLEPENHKKIREVLDKNKPKTIDDEEVLERIKKVIELLLQDHTVAEIAFILDESANTINKDINKRLSEISSEKLKEIGIDKEKLAQLQIKLLEHSRKNLINNPLNPRTKKH